MGFLGPALGGHWYPTGPAQLTHPELHAQELELEARAAEENPKIKTEEIAAFQRKRRSGSNGQWSAWSRQGGVWGLTGTSPGHP